MSITRTRELERYMGWARFAGCPQDQVANFCRAGIVLQPKQLAASAAARQCDRDGGPVEIGYGGARMGGKSHWMLAQMGADDCQRHPGLKCLLLRKVGSSAQENFESLLPKTIGRLGEFVPTRSLFRCHNGSWIKIGHFKDERDVDKYLGLEYDVIGIEEDTTLTASKRTNIRSCCRSPLGSGWRARTYSTTNPGGVGHAAYRRRFIDPFRAGREADTRFVPATVTDNAFAPREYVAFLDGLTGWLRRAWRDGDWDIAAGQFFTTFSRAHHAVPRVEILPSWPVWLALDYGFTHYTAAYLMAKDGDGNVFAVAEHAERRWLVERNAAAILAMCDRHGVAPHRLGRAVAGLDVFAKKQNGGTIADDYRAHKIPLKPANVDRINGAAEVLRRIGDPAAVGPDGEPAPIAPKLFISEACPRLLECLPALEHDPHRPEDVLKVDADDDGVGGDDYYDAFRYGLMVDARPRQGVVGAYATPPTPADHA